MPSKYVTIASMKPTCVKCKRTGSQVTLSEHCRTVNLQLGTPTPATTALDKSRTGFPTSGPESPFSGLTKE